MNPITTIADEMAATPHRECEDSWYSCPLSSEGCSDERQSGCTCGVERIHELAAKLRALAAPVAGGQEFGKELDELLSASFDQDWDRERKARATVERLYAQAAQPVADPCPTCPQGAVCKTPSCGRLNAQAAQAVKVPDERIAGISPSARGVGFRDGWNACRAEVLRLNPEPKS